MEEIIQQPFYQTSLVRKLDQFSKWLAVLAACSLPISTSVFNISFLLSVVFNLLSGGYREKFTLIFKNKVAISFVCFFSLSLIGALYSSASHHYILKAINHYSKYLLAIFYIPILIEERWRKYLVNGYIAAMVFTALVSLKTAAGILPSWYLHYSWVGKGNVFHNYIETSFLMVMATYLLAIKLVSTPAHRWLKGGLILIMSYQILFVSASRSGYFVYFSLALLFSLQYFGWKGLIVGVGVAAVAGVLFLSFSHVGKGRYDLMKKNYVSYTKGNSISSIGERLSYARSSVKIFEKHPIFGVGTAGLFPALNLLKKEDSSVLTTDNPHDEYLNEAVQFGLIGLIALLAVFFLCWRESLKLEWPMKCLLQGCVVAIMSGSLMNSWLLNTIEGHFFGLFVMLAIATQYTYSQKLLSKKAVS